LEKMARHIGFYGFGVGNKEQGTKGKEVGGQMAEVGVQPQGHVVGDNSNNGGDTDKYPPVGGSPVRYGDDDEEHWADVRRWIQEAREQAVYDTERRLREEFALLNKEQGTRTGRW
jgi:hypothetical protein